MSVISCGNCKGKIIRGEQAIAINRVDNFEQLTLPHNFKQTITTNGIGLFEEMLFSIEEFRLQENDKIVLMSDGIYQVFNQQEFLFLEKNAKSTEAFLSDLFNLSRERGSKDNQTAIILSI